MIKVLASVCALGALTGIALAQTTPAPPVGPTKVECNQGYRDGSPWTLQQFVAACDKLRQGQGQ